MNTDTALKIISMFTSSAIWGALFVVIFFITRAIGMTKNLPKEVKRRLAEFNKYNESFIEKVSDDKPDQEKELVKWFKKLKSMQRVISKIFAVYAYEHPLIVECTPVTDSIGKIKTAVIKVSACISRNQYDEISNCLKTITPLIETADKQIDKVIAVDEEEKILHA